MSARYPRTLSPTSSSSLVLRSFTRFPAAASLPLICGLAGYLVTCGGDCLASAASTPPLMETAAISLHRLRLWVIVTYGSISKPSDSFGGVVGAASHSGHCAIIPMKTKLGSWSCSRRKWTWPATILITRWKSDRSCVKIDVCVLSVKLIS